MKVAIKGIGAWGHGFTDWPELQRLLNGEVFEPAGSASPKPAVIPANERRRAPLPVRLAVEACTQAVTAANLDASNLACVFSSGLGDTDLTDYMCRELASASKQLSPTKFHNSVHNAAAGYWTIATGCQQPANSVAGLENSVTVALLEGICQCLAEQTPVILAFYDIPTCTVLGDLFANQQSFAVALIISPVSDSTENILIDCELTENLSPAWPELKLPGNLADCYRHNPSARILPLLLALLGKGDNNLDLPLSSESSLSIQMLSRSKGLGNSERKS